MKKEKIVFVWICFALVILLILYFDSEIVKGVSLIRNNFLNDFFIGIIYLSSKTIIFLFLTSLFLWTGHKRKWILPLWFTFFLSAIISFLLKISIQRQRPFQLDIATLVSPILEKASHAAWNFSFASSHAMLAFCALPLLSKEFPRLKKIWIIFASLVAFSRVYLGLHFLSDVVVGGLIGYLIGIMILRLEQDNKFFDKIYKKIFG